MTYDNIYRIHIFPCLLSEAVSTSFSPSLATIATMSASTSSLVILHHHSKREMDVASHHRTCKLASVRRVRHRQDCRPAFTPTLNDEAAPGPRLALFRIVTQSGAILHRQVLSDYSELGGRKYARIISVCSLLATALLTHAELFKKSRQK